MTATERPRVRAGYLSRIRQAKMHREAMNEGIEEQSRPDWRRAFCDAKQVSLDIYDDALL